MANTFSEQTDKPNHLGANDSEQTILSILYGKLLGKLFGKHFLRANHLGANDSEQTILSILYGKLFGKDDFEQQL